MTEERWETLVDEWCEDVLADEWWDKALTEEGREETFEGEWWEDTGFVDCFTQPARCFPPGGTRTWSPAAGATSCAWPDH